MEKSLAVLVLAGALVATADAADGERGQADKRAGNATLQPTGSAQAGNFRWTNSSGETEVVKGKIDKWNDKGQLEAGGILGLGDTDLNVTGETVIVAADGRRLQRSDLRVGSAIASIYRENNRGERKSGASEKVALVIVVDTNK